MRYIVELHILVDIMEIRILGGLGYDQASFIKTHSMLPHYPGGGRVGEPILAGASGLESNGRGVPLLGGCC